MQQHHIDYGLQGKGQPRLGAMVREAWQLSLRPNFRYAGLALLWYVVMFYGVFKAVPWLEGQGMELQKAMDLAVLGLVVILAPVVAALELMGMKQALGQPISGRELWQCTRLWGRLALLAVLVSMVVSLGFLLLVLPAIYLYASLSLANLVMIGGRASSLQSMVWSLRAAYHHWWTVFGVMLVVGAAFVIAAATFGVALVWLAPFTFILRGILFRELFGLRTAEPENAPSTATDDSRFVA
ncbi:MAG: hypothetical protein II007_04030 [Gammaproteobacteria bacterium]|nr:hypothetical protein [Gammaproteobacteria bacterium]